MKNYLKPIFENVKSYYKKAYTIIEGKRETLYSYGVPVASIYESDFVLYKDYDYSATTLRHVKEFVQQCGFGKVTKKELDSLYLQQLEA